ncbi:MAG TPA: transcriptional regulator [Rubricoccaceae bacterium]|jgi:DNA-binding winged helix-turn-helix (wHTH) protein
MSVSTAEDDVTYRFGDFILDATNRQLWRGGDRVDLTARYFDALVLLVQEHGRLVEKDRFFAEVWGDVVVSDSALTQCIKDVRKGLGDDAANPRYVETVPRHGYRFIAQVEAIRPERVRPEAVLFDVAPHALSTGAASVPQAGPSAVAGDVVLPPRAERGPMHTAVLWGTAGALGGGFAGVLGGLLYGSALAYAPDARLGTASVLVVLLSLNVLVGVVGGAGVSFGMAAVGWATRGPFRWSVAGAALGGLLVGGGAKLLGMDAFNLLFGRAPAGITGGLEGGALGAALALGARLGGRRDSASRWRPVAGAGLAGAVAGALIPAAGGHLMGGSLDLLARSFAGSRLRLDGLGRLFGEVHFGQTAQMVLGGVEGFLFATCVVGALVMARLALSGSARPAGS